MRPLAYFPRVFRAFVPPARTPWSGWALAPLAIFLLQYGTLIFTTELCGWMRFVWKPAFWFLLATPWIWWLHFTGYSGLRGWRAHLALQTRLWLVGVFAAMLADPRAVRRSESLSVMYALDVSHSMNEAVESRSLDWIRDTVKTKQEKDEAGLVVFGREAMVELPPRPGFPLEAIGSIVPRDGSNLAKGLRMAGAMLPEENSGRVVLISDGNQTDGEALAAADELKARGIAVDILRIGFDLEKEVWLERLDLPRLVKQGESYDAAVLLSSLTDGHGSLRLAENGRVIFSQDVQYKAGKNRFAVPLPARPPGYYEYVASIIPPKGEDFWDKNNQATGDVYLKGEGRILVLTDARGDTREWEDLVAALKEGKRIVQVDMTYEAPRDATSLLPYDLIVIPNAPADGFDAMQMQALHDAVFNLGSGLLMLGNEQTFGPGGYQRTVLAKALPVEMEVSQKKVLPLGALVVALDRSGSMAALVNGEPKLALANRGAAGAWKVLGEQDYFGVLAVDTMAHTVVPLAQHGAKDAVLEKIHGITVGGGGIYVYTALSQASFALKGVEAATKHVILFADAADAEEQASGGTSAFDLVSAMQSVKITTTVVALGRQSDKDTEFLRELAARGQGRFYLTSDANDLPQIFVKEAKTVKRAMLQKRTFVPQIMFPSPVLKGVEAMPPLHGYVLTQPKPTASVVLQAPQLPDEVAQGDAPDPILAIWRYGLGTGTAWTSDFAPNWARDWMGWDQYRAFIKQLVTEISRVDRKSDLRMTAAATGTRGLIDVEDFAPGDRFLEMKARVSGPRQETIEIPVLQTAPRRYRAEFPLWGEGRYQVAVVGVGGRGANGQPEAEQVFGGFALPYSPEYLRFKSDPVLLERIAERTGGRLLKATDLNVYEGRHMRESSKPVFDWFLFALAFLVPLDVAVRRVQLDWALLAGLLWRRSKGRSTETMGALLERKKQVQSANPSVERPAPIILSSRPAAPSPKPPAPAKPVPEVKTDPAVPQTTTERLLARKRKRMKDDDSAG